MTAVCRPDDYERVLDELRTAGGGYRWHAPCPRSARIRDDRGLRRRDRRLARSRHGVPRDVHARLRPGRSSWPTARTRTSGRAYYAERGARTHLLARVEQLHGKPLSYNNLQRPLCRARALARAERAVLRDRQAREPLRRRDCGDGRGGVREGARPPIPSLPTAASSSSRTPSRRRSASGSPSSSWRCCSPRATTSRRSKRSSSSPAPASSTTSSGAPSPLEGRDLKRVLGGVARAGSGRRPGRPQRRWTSSAARSTQATWDDLLFALDGRQARHVERDRARPRTDRRSGSARAR